MSELIIRDAKRAEIGVILALCHAGAVETGRYPEEDATHPGVLAGFDAISADPNNRLVVVERLGEVIGTFQITFIPALVSHGRWRGQIENVHVREDMRGKGIGEQMIAWALGRFREKGCEIVQLTSNKKRVDAHRFYERLGFKRTHDGFKLTL